jgi:hypothetical protein
MYEKHNILAIFLWHRPRAAEREAGGTKLQRQDGTGGGRGRGGKQGLIERQVGN